MRRWSSEKTILIVTVFNVAWRERETGERERAGLQYTNKEAKEEEQNT